ncbi:transcription factor bHLH94-like isoform X2 [Curcuma longa]|uniref:transcription factor bHLH94-like isoform X2 n=1 Tax=Curcuma longa TaxID=136217 RepID=UPI003D9E7979
MVVQMKASGTAGGRRRQSWRRKRLKEEEVAETQRMTHITVERNRRKQMNDYLAVLRSLMPPSYVQRVDQASIVGGAISFVKDLERSVEFLEARKRIKHKSNLFAAADENMAAAADVEVSLQDRHANVKIFSRRRPRQLLSLVLAFHTLRLTAIHLNITTIDAMVLYNFNLKVEDDCHFTSVDAIATAVHQIIARIQEELS